MGGIWTWISGVRGGQRGLRLRVVRDLDGWRRGWAAMLPAQPGRSFTRFAAGSAARCGHVAKARDETPTQIHDPSFTRPLGERLAPGLDGPRLLQSSVEMRPPEVTNAQARTTALLLLGSGAFFLKFGYCDVLRDAEAHVTTVTTMTKVIVFAPAFLMIGLVLLVTGAPSASSAIGRLMARPEDGEIAPLGMVLLLATLLPGVALYLWLMHRLAQLGFQ